MSTHAATHDSHDHHVTPPSALVKNLVILAFFMALTILAAKVDFGHAIPGVSSAVGSFINNIVALIIACIKAYFVVSVFMGVKWGSKLIKLWALTGFVWLPLLLGIFGDYIGRDWEPVRAWTPPSQVQGRRLADEPAFESERRNDDKRWSPPKPGEAPAEH